MNNVYFSKEGMTSTTANYYANIAKELQNAATERLNNVKFFNTSVAVIGSSDKQIMSKGIDTLEYIQSDLQTLASMNAFCAWVREAIKEKENQANFVRRTSMEEWAENNGIAIPTAPKFPKDPSTITEQQVIDTWDINKRNKYFRLEAFAATYGKYIHLEGAYNKARKRAHTALNNPITTEGTGRDLILYYTEASVPIEHVDKMFMMLQDQYRSYEKELNYMKAELKEEVNALTTQAYDQYQKELDEHNARTREYNSAWNELRSKFLAWKTNESERISKLKIAIPDALKSVFKEVQAAGDTSK